MKKGYKIVTDIKDAQLEHSVSNLLNEGWELLGGLTITSKGPDDDGDFEHLVYGQAMVKSVGGDERKQIWG